VAEEPKEEKIKIPKQELKKELEQMEWPSDVLHGKSKVAKIRDEHHTRNPLAAFSVLPEEVEFETQDPEEKILLLARRHLMTNLKWMLVGVLMLVAPFWLNYFPILAFLPSRFQLVSVVMWYLLTIGFLLENFLSWYFNVYIVTDERIIDVDFYSLIYKRISAAKIDHIEDVTATTGGAARNLFDFGTVSIQTAGEKREFEFEDVPHPARIVKFLNLMIMEEEKEKMEGRIR